MSAYISSVNLWTLAAFLVVVVLGYFFIRKRELKWRYKQKEMAKKKQT
jgi:hypothetical protein